MKRSTFVLAAATVVGLAGLAQATTLYSQGFETDNAGWNVLGGSNDATRVSSGTNGVTSFQGSHHAEAAGPNSGGQTDDGSAFTRWGGYNFGAGNAVPTAFQSYTTSLAIYLDVNGGAANDTRFDWDSAINNSAGNFLRDFVFNGGFYNDTDATGSGARFVFSASNNATRSGAFPKNPGRDPFAITSTGWYTFEHTFYDNGGLLAADLSILDSSNTTLHTWTVTTSDPIASVGGNRYGYVAFNEFPFLAIDNAELRTNGPAAVPLPASAWGGLALLGGLGLVSGLKRIRHQHAL